MDFPIVLVFHYNSAMPIKKFRIQLDKPSGDFDDHPLRVNVIVAPMRTAIRDKIISPEVEAAFWGGASGAASFEFSAHGLAPNAQAPLRRIPHSMKSLAR
jgi:hypothetical protein